MKDDEKQIEEMAKVMCSSYESGKGCKTCPTNWCYADECATMAYYNDYRKILKDEVVLNKYEYEQICQELLAAAEDKQLACKETAEKFANAVKDRIKFIKTYLHAEGAEYVGIEGYEIDDILIGGFGVEIKE